MTRPSTSCWPTPRPPARSSPRPSRSTTTAIELKAKKPNDLKVKTRQGPTGKGDRDAARATLDGVLKEDPEHPEAKALREEIDREKGGIMRANGTH